MAAVDAAGARRRRLPTPSCAGRNQLLLTATVMAFLLTNAYYFVRQRPAALPVARARVEGGHAAPSSAAVAAQESATRARLSELASQPFPDFDAPPAVDVEAEERAAAAAREAAAEAAAEAQRREEAIVAAAAAPVQPTKPAVVPGAEESKPAAADGPGGAVVAEEGKAAVEPPPQPPPAGAAASGGEEAPPPPPATADPVPAPVPAGAVQQPSAAASAKVDTAAAPAAASKGAPPTVEDEVAAAKRTIEAAEQVEAQKKAEREAAAAVAAAGATALAGAAAASGATGATATAPSPPPSPSPPAQSPPPPPAQSPPSPPRACRALWFTMDSLSQYVARSATGGPAGEIAVRTSLVWALETLGCTVVVAQSDAEMEAATATPALAGAFTLFFFDEWTVVSPNLQPRWYLQGREDTVFILSFFGNAKLPPSLALPPHHILTPYPIHDAATFVGFALQPKWQLPAQPAAADGGLRGSKAAVSGSGSGDIIFATAAKEDAKRNAALPPPPAKTMRAVMWGKHPSYFENKTPLVAAAASLLETVSSVVGPPWELSSIGGLVLRGHLAPDAWNMLLAESRMFIGVGDPLAGPSALEALAAGCAFINPIFPSPRQTHFGSQHPYIKDRVPPEYVCNYILDNVQSLIDCVKHVMASPQLPPYLPPDFTRAAHLKRVYNIFKPFLPAPAPAAAAA